MSVRDHCTGPAAAPLQTSVVGVISRSNRPLDMGCHAFSPTRFVCICCIRMHQALPTLSPSIICFPRPCEPSAGLCSGDFPCYFLFGCKAIALDPRKGIVVVPLAPLLWLGWPCTAPPPPLFGVLRPIPFGAGVICDPFFCQTRVLVQVTKMVDPRLPGTAATERNCLVVTCSSYWYRL